MDKKESQRYSILVQKSDRLVSLERAFSYCEQFKDISYREKLSIKDEKMKCLEFLVTYFKRIGLKENKDYYLYPNSFSAICNITCDQARVLRRQDYVLNVAEDYGNLRNECVKDENGRVL